MTHQSSLYLVDKMTESATAATTTAGNAGAPTNWRGGAAQQKKKNTMLKELHQVPMHLRFNRYVLTHYRPKTDWKGCVSSLFYFHNETVNIVTHGE